MDKYFKIAKHADKAWMVIHTPSGIPLMKWCGKRKYAAKVIEVALSQGYDWSKIIPLPETPTRADIDFYHACRAASEGK